MEVMFMNNDKNNVDNNMAVNYHSTGFEGYDGIIPDLEFIDYDDFFVEDYQSEDEEDPYSNPPDDLDEWI